MFAKSIEVFTPELALVKMVSSEVPEEFPLVSDGIDNVGSGYKLAPGSTIYVSGTTQLFMLGENDDWTEQ